MVKCAVCKKREATQEHHLSYDPELRIDICLPCHVKLHEHGVGRGRGQQPSEAFPIEEDVPQLPIFTKIIEKDGVEFIVTKETEEILNMMRCINGCSLGWQLLLDPSTNRLFLRCPHCGWDLEVKRIG